MVMRLGYVELHEFTLEEFSILDLAFAHSPHRIFTPDEKARVALFKAEQKHVSLHGY
jgi:hypothetical protein